MRFVCNLVGGLLLAVGLVFAVGDIARSLADGTMRLATVAEAFAAMGLPLVPGAASLSPRGVDLVATMSAWPMSVTFGLAAFLFLFIGRPPHRRRGRFAR